MRKYVSLSVVAASMISAGVLAGCEKTDAPTTPSSSSTPATMPPTTSPMSGAMHDATTAVKEGAGALTKPAADMPAKPAIEIPAIPSTDAPVTPPPAAGAAETDSTSKATELLTQATTYIKENKLDLAEKAITQLDALKPNLPAAYQSKIDSVHSAFDAMKKGDSLKDSLKNGLLGK